MVCGGVCQTPTYLSGKGKEACQKEFERQIEIFLKNDVDFLLAEVSFHTLHDSEDQISNNDGGFVLVV